MRSFNYCWVLLLLIISFPLFVQAADYAWYSSYWNISRSTPMAVCIAMNSGSSTGMTFTMESNGIEGYCKYNGVNYNGFVQRTGNSCPAGSAYNSSTGVCVSTTCEQNWSGGEKVFSHSKGQCVKYPNLSPQEYCTWASGKGSSYSQATVSSNSADGPQQYVDTVNKCVTSTQSAECTSRVNKDGAGSYSCKVTGAYTGQYNPAATNNPDGYCPTGNCQEPPEVPDVPTPTPQEIKDSQPCNYASDGNGGLICSSSSSTQKEGTSNCGTVNGVWKCISKAPTNNGIDVITTVKTTTNPDNSTTTTKTDKATVTSCTGIGSCTTTTTTTTTTTNKDGSGTTTSVKGTCSGPQCPDKNTNPDGDGDGFGDCIGSDCGTGEGEGGGAADWYEPGDDTYQSVIEAYADRIADTPVIGGVSNFLTFTPSGACPVYSVNAWVFNIRLDQWCEGSTIPWDLIKAVILACCAFFAFRIAFL
jgi:hypothetical protein